MDITLPLKTSLDADPPESCPLMELEPAPKQDAVYSDGSFYGHRCAAVVVEESGRVWALHPPQGNHHHNGQNYTAWRWVRLWHSRGVCPIGLAGGHPSRGREPNQSDDGSGGAFHPDATAVQTVAATGNSRTCRHSGK